MVCILSEIHECYFPTQETIHFPERPWRFWICGAPELICNHTRVREFDVEEAILILGIESDIIHEVAVVASNGRNLIK